MPPLASMKTAVRLARRFSRLWLFSRADTQLRWCAESRKLFWRLCAMSPKPRNPKPSPRNRPRNPKPPETPKPSWMRRHEAPNGDDWPRLAKFPARGRRKPGGRGAPPDVAQNASSACGAIPGARPAARAKPPRTIRVRRRGVRSGTMVPRMANHGFSARTSLAAASAMRRSASARSRKRSATAFSAAAFTAST